MQGGRKLQLAIAIAMFVVVSYDILRHAWASYHIPYYDYPLYARGKKKLFLHRACQQFSTVLSLEPNNYWAHFEIGRLYWHLYETKSNPQHLFYAQFHFYRAQQLVPFWGLPYIYLAQISQRNNQNVEQLMLKAQTLAPTHVSVLLSTTVYWLQKYQQQTHKKIHLDFIRDNLLFLNYYNAIKYGKWSIVVAQSIFAQDWQQVIPQHLPTIITLIPSVIELQNFNAARQMIQDITGHPRQKRVLQKYLHLSSTLPKDQQQVFDFFDFLFANDMQNDALIYAQHLLPYVQDRAIFYANLAYKFQEKGLRYQALSWIRNALRIQPDNSHFKERKQQILQMQD